MPNFFTRLNIFLVIESEDEEGGEGEEEEALSDDAEVVRNKPMTKRQRAKVFHDVPEEYLELPMGKLRLYALSLL